MNRRAPVAVLLFLLALVFAADGVAQDGKQQRIADLAYEAEMAHDVADCPDAITLTDRNVCLNDANALALDGTEVVWEKYRVTACDAMVKVYDAGTVKHPGASAPSAQTRCLIQLTRSRMRDLKQLYEPTL